MSMGERTKPASVRRPHEHDSDSADKRERDRTVITISTCTCENYQPNPDCPIDGEVERFTIIDSAGFPFVRFESTRQHALETACEFDATGYRQVSRRLVDSKGRYVSGPRHGGAHISQLGALSTAIGHALGSVDAFLDDPITRASSCGDEFLPDVRRRALKRVHEILDAAGVTPEQYDMQLSSRVDAKWLHFSGVGWVLHNEIEALS